MPLANAGALNLAKAVSLSLPSTQQRSQSGISPVPIVFLGGQLCGHWHLLGRTRLRHGSDRFRDQGSPGRSPSASRPPTAMPPPRASRWRVSRVPSDGNCVALGQYVNAANQLPFTVTEVDGVWQRRRSGPAGGRDDHQSSPPPRTLSPASTNGNCTVVGTYTTNATSFATRGFMKSEVHGVWRTRSDAVVARRHERQSLRVAVAGLVLGGDRVASPWAPTSTPTASRTPSWCPKSTAYGRRPCRALPGNASAFAGAQFNEVTASRTARAWRREPTTPTPARCSPWSPSRWRRVEPGARSRSCPTRATNPAALSTASRAWRARDAGNCAFGGQYLDKSGHYQGFLDNVVNGSRATRQVLALPAGAIQPGTTVAWSASVARAWAPASRARRT